MVDVEADVVRGRPKKRMLKKFNFRGVNLDAVLNMSIDKLVKLFSASVRRRFQRGLTRKPMTLIKKFRKENISLVQCPIGSRARINTCEVDKELMERELQVEHARIVHTEIDAVESERMRDSIARQIWNDYVSQT